MESLENGIELNRFKRGYFKYILFYSLDTDSWESGYKDIKIYGANYDSNKEKYILKKINVKDYLEIEFLGKLFKKIKYLTLKIDFPIDSIGLAKETICLSCGEYYFEVYNRRISLIKKKRVYKNE